ncbi:hypothetical protein EIP86_010443 [Pleurotus ostreatoroseus]|nr:hypothetical protein EIP86_010443 [Pleurotus ostreatoroseus]
MSQTTDIDFCAIKLVPSDQEAEAVRIALEVNPNNWPLQTSPPANIPGHGSILLGVDVDRMWSPGQVVKVSFIGGSDYVRSQVRKYARMWSQYANITFEFVDGWPSDIRVGFVQGDGTWSARGTDCKLYDRITRTMNFGTLDDDSEESAFRRHILHEFGHALGCVHEHQQPNANIQWNKEVVYESYRRTQGWSREKVDREVLNHYTADKIPSTPFDGQSIMAYRIPPEFTLDGFSFLGGNTLSGADKAFIGSRYPFHKLIDKYYTGTADTNSIRDWRHPQHDNRIHVRFPSELPERPFVLLGLKYLDFGKNHNLRIECDIDSISRSRMTVNLHSWAATVHYRSACAWLVPSAADEDFQFGHWSTIEDHPSNRPKRQTYHYIRFPRPYQHTPKVVVFLDCLDVDSDYNTRVKVYPSSVSPVGFYLNIESWGDTVLYRASAYWAAHSPGKANLCSGTFSTNDIRYWRPPRSDNTGTATFDTTFRAPPQIFMGLNLIDLGENGGQRLNVSVDHIMPKTMEWHLDAWDDTKLYQAAASYIAFVNE